MVPKFYCPDWVFQPLVDVLSFGYARNPWLVRPSEPTSMNHHQQERKQESLVTKETKKSLGQGSINTTLTKYETQLYFYSYAYNHTNPSRKWSFLKSSSNRRNFKRRVFRLRVDGDILKTKLFENDDVTIIQNDW